MEPNGTRGNLIPRSGQGSLNYSSRLTMLVHRNTKVSCCYIQWRDWWISKSVRLISNSVCVMLAGCKLKSKCNFHLSWLAWGNLGKPKSTNLGLLSLPNFHLRSSSFKRRETWSKPIVSLYPCFQISISKSLIQTTRTHRHQTGKQTSPATFLFSFEAA